MYPYSRNNLVEALERFCSGASSSFQSLFKHATDTARTRTGVTASS